MIRHSSFVIRHSRLLLLAALAALTGLASAAQPEDWWNPAWAYRKRLSVRLPAVQPFRFAYVPPQAVGEDLVAAEALVRYNDALKGPAAREVRIVDAGGNLLPAVVEGPDARGLVRATFPARRTIAGQLAEPIQAETRSVRLTVGRDKAVTPGIRFFAVAGPDRVATLQIESVADKTATARVLERTVPAIAAGNPVRSEDLTDAEYFLYYGNPAPPGEGPTWTPSVSPVAQFVWSLTGESAPTSVALLQQVMRAAPGYVGVQAHTQINSRANPLNLDTESNYVSAYESYVHCPIAGLYRFALSTGGPAFLYVDGKLTIQRPGFFYQIADQWEHRGKADLTQGYHHLVLFAVESGKRFITRLGWQPVTAKVYDLVPASFFVNRIQADVTGFEGRDQREQTFFAYSPAPRSVLASGSPFLAVGDILAWPELCARLANEGSASAPSPGARLWELLPPGVRTAVQRAAKAEGLDPAAKADIVGALNDALKRSDLYREKDFPQVSLPAEVLVAIKMAREGLPDERLPRFNRLLLEAVYPKELAKSRKERCQFVQFHNLSPFQPKSDAETVTYLWDFGDGEQSRDARPGHLFALPATGVAASYTATLRAALDGKPLGEYKQPVFCDPTPAEELNLSLDIVSFANIVYADERTNIAVRVRNPGYSPVLLRAVGRLTSHQGIQTLLRRLMTIPAQDEDFCILPVDLKQLEEKRASLQLDFFLGSQRVLSAAARILPSPQELAALQPGLGALYDPEGRRIMICTEIEDADRHLRWVFLRYLRDEVYNRRAGTRRRVLLFGDRMANAVPTGQTFTDYVALLERDLPKEGRSLQFVSRSTGLLPTLADLPLFAKTLESAESPDLVILSPGLADVAQAAGPRDFARSIDVMVDCIRATGRPIKPILVSPPPLPGNPRLSAHYTRALEAVAKAHHIPFLDLDALLTREPEDWQRAYYGADADGIFYPNPNEAGHRRIAEELLKILY